MVSIRLTGRDHATPPARRGNVQGRGQRSTTYGPPGVQGRHKTETNWTIPTKLTFSDWSPTQSGIGVRRLRRPGDGVNIYSRGAPEPPPSTRPERGELPRLGFRT